MISARGRGRGRARGPGPDGCWRTAILAPHPAIMIQVAHVEPVSLNTRQGYPWRALEIWREKKDLERAVSPGAGQCFDAERVSARPQ